MTAIRRRILKAGNNLVVSLPIDWARERGLREGMEINVEISPADSLEIRPHSPGSQIAPEFAEQVAEFISEHREVLDELARR